MKKFNFLEILSSVREGFLTFLQVVLVALCLPAWVLVVLIIWLDEIKE